ncbi:MAG: nucleotidyl transferase AbiEii/AbiGii toxin family protein [Gemmatimonadaceae bacterium]|nr:nucleotidyl transferase AbiEii/AbiGii toxin family protein [Gemmatimonadaceae bacterium]
MMLSGLLQKAAKEDGCAAMTVKGGVALELRLHPTPRATDDIDLVIHGAGDLVQSFDSSLVPENGEPREHGGFTFQRKGEPRDLHNGAWRIEIAVRYEGTAWNTISVDLAGEELPDVAPEYINAIDLAPLRLPGPASVPCLPLTHQLAQKIHGMTHPPREGRRNERAKDLVDVLLLKEELDDLAELRLVCLSVFAKRGTHEWPPMLEVHEHWREEVLRLSEEYGLGNGTLEEGVSKARTLIARIDKSGK